MRRLIHHYRSLSWPVHVLVAMHIMAALLAGGGWGLVRYAKVDVIQRYSVCGLGPAYKWNPADLVWTDTTLEKGQGPVLWFRLRASWLNLEHGWPVKEAVSIARLRG